MARPTTKAERAARAAAPLVCVGNCGAVNPDRSNPKVTRWTCDECHPGRDRDAAFRYWEGNRAKSIIRGNHIGLSVDDYEDACEAQDWRCAGCGREDRLHVDHDHAMNCEHRHNRSCPDCRRGLLCGPCNRALGMAGDNVETLLSLAAYLMRWEQSHEK